MRLNGLSSREVERNRKEYGLNDLTQMPRKPFGRRMGNICKNPFMLVTAVTLAVQTAVFFMGYVSWLIPLETLAAAVITAVVSAAADGKNEKNAESAFDEGKTRQSAKVVRDGNMMEVQFNQVVVGDMVLLQSGDKVPADGEIAYGRITVDQTMLGGSAGAEKVPPPERVKNYDTSDLSNRYYIHRGSVVTGGEAYMYVKAVGDKTLFGRNAMQKDYRIRQFPKISFGRLLARKAFFGYAAAFCILTAVFISSLTVKKFNIYAVLVTVSGMLGILGLSGFFVTKGKTILTEGYVYDRLQKLSVRNIFVKNINALARTGKIKVLLADKTGILTNGRFSVSALADGEGMAINSLTAVSEKLLTEICIGIGIHNSSNASGMTAVGGERTDRAMLAYLISANVMGTVIRQSPLKLKGYDPQKKYAGAVSVNGDIYIKGNADTVVKMCDFCMNAEGNRQTIDRETLSAYILEQSRQGNRVIAAAKSCEHHQYMLLCMVSLKDGIGRDTAQFIRDTHTHVVMLTSDGKECAFAAAQSMGLVQNIHDIYTMAEVSEENFSDVRVLADVSADDKQKLAEMFQSHGMKIAVAADSVYDVKLLEQADIGIAFQNGSDTAKNAADIIILDDNILSLKQIIK